MENQLAKIKTVFENEDVKKKFTEILGSKSTGFIVSVINIIESNALLAKAERDSILFAAATAAALDLPINPNLGFAYIVPYENSKTKEVKAQFQMGYKGFIQLAQRAGQFKTISATPIYKGQLVSENPLTGYVFDFNRKESDEVVGYAAYFELMNGFQKTLYMTVQELKKHGLTYSQSYKSTKSWISEKSLWNTNFDAMASKTVLKLLLSKFAPLSIEMQKAVLVDQSVIEDWDANKLGYIDNTLETHREASDRKERERVLKHVLGATTLIQLQEVEKHVQNSDDEELKQTYSIKKSSFDTESFETKEEVTEDDGK